LTNIDLQAIARGLDRALKEANANGVTDENQLLVQAISVAEEAGEVMGAYRRWAGLARRSGSKGELGEEIADLLIVTAVFAELTDIDIAQAVQAKLKIIYSRGWSEDVPKPQQSGSSSVVRGEGSHRSGGVGPVPAPATGSDQAQAANAEGRSSRRSRK
jgi:NTP pyrophosphatase (non-canonical NTP hydrolase)